MSKPKRRKQSSRQRPAKPGARRVSVLTVTVVLAVGIFVAVALLRGGALGGTGSPLPSPAVPGVQSAATAVTATAGFQPLRGRWLRPDGGYILDIRDVDASGKIDAVYLNPRPIHVARAEATGDGATLQVFVELRAPGYPGSTYTLRYEPQRDQLEGSYFQAALQQRFDGGVRADEVGRESALPPGENWGARCRKPCTRQERGGSGAHAKTIRDSIPVRLSRRGQG